jgi:hypothetical protein
LKVEEEVKQENSMKRATSIASCYLLYAGFFLGLFFDPEDEGDMLLRNAGGIANDYAALDPFIKSL